MKKQDVIALTVVATFLVLALTIMFIVSRDAISKSYNDIKKEVTQIKVMQKQITDVDKNISDKLDSIEADLNKLKNTTPRMIKVTTTFYCPAAKGINSDSDHTNTATMTKPISGYTIAISKSLFKKGWLGHKVYVEGWGVFKIEDRMDKSIEGDCIDICIGTKKEAILRGRLHNIVMIRLS